MSVEDDKAPQLSEYANTRDPLVKEKVHAEIDFFLISGKNYNGECLPPIESIDLISYLVLETSYYTKEPSRVFKHITTCSLDLNRVFTDS